MRKMKQMALLGLFFLFFDSALAADTEKVRITFPHSVPGHAQRGNVLLVVHYGENEANVKLVVAWIEEDSGFGGESELDITPENDGVPLMRDLDLPVGKYVFMAELSRSDGSKFVAKRERFVTR